MLAKATSVEWQGKRINIVDTPGHADFGGEVERILSMVDGVVLLVDSSEGAMPQTKFVTGKALALGLRPIVVVNKIDRPGARPDWVIDQVFDLFDKLGATNEQLDFPIRYGSGKNGWMDNSPEENGNGMTPLFELVLKHVAPPVVEEGAFRLLGTILEANPYLGRIITGRIASGSIKPNQAVKVLSQDGKTVETGRISKILAFRGIERQPIEEAHAGDIVAIAGMSKATVADTLCALEVTEALDAQPIDPPTISMTVAVNDSPLAGREGDKVQSRIIRDRLLKEAEANVAIRATETGGKAAFQVAGRGELQLGVLIENMRREGFELAVSRPEVIIKEIDGQLMEPVEQLVVDIEEQHQGGVMEKLGTRKGQLKNMEPDGKGRVRLDYEIPARGLIGFQNEFKTLTQGSGLLFHVFDHYGPKEQGAIAKRLNGVMIANAPGATPAYALGPLQERGKLFAAEGDNVYEGQLIGIHSKDNDLTVNAIKTKPLTNMRASGKDDAIQLSPAIKYTLEQALDFIEDNELVEVTPKEIRLRKKFLTESDRKRAGRAA